MAANKGAEPADHRDMGAVLSTGNLERGGGEVGGGVPGRLVPGGNTTTIPVNGDIGTVDIAAIVIAVVNAAIHGITAATAAHTSGATLSVVITLSLLKLLHFRRIYRVATNIGRGSRILHEICGSCKPCPTPNIRYVSLPERLPGLL